MKNSLSSLKKLVSTTGFLRDGSKSANDLEATLQNIGQTLRVERVGFYKLNEDGSQFHPIALWAEKSIRAQDKASLAVDKIEELDSSLAQALAEPVFKDGNLAGALIFHTAELQREFTQEDQCLTRNFAIMLSRQLDTPVSEDSPPKLNRPEESSEVPSENKLQILIVEDDRSNVFILEKFIERFGAVSHTAYDGLEAIQLCKEMKFDVILMDLSMPKLDGFDATREIVTGENLNRTTPIIAVTADVTDGIERRCKKIGIQHYIAKPVRRESIIRAITDLTKRPPKPEET